MAWASQSPSGRSPVLPNVTPSLTSPAGAASSGYRRASGSPSWALRCPPASLHVSMATMLSVREDYGISKDAVWAN